MRELFFYWRTAAGSAASAEQALHRWHGELCAAHPGLQAALYRRVDEGQCTVTLMEVYALGPEAGGGASSPLASTLEQRITQDGDALLAPWLEGPRKVEVFERRPAPPARPTKARAPSPGA